MFPHTVCLMLVMSLCLVGASTAADGGGPLGERNHVDPCGNSSDPSLVCCIGHAVSTLIRQDEECCEGRAVARVEICCDGRMLVALASPSHDSCCVDGDTDQGITYHSATHFCNRRTGRVQQKFVFDWLPNTVPVNLGSSDGSPSRFRSPFFLRHFRSRCGPGRDENRSVGPRWRGESVRCCAGVAYYPSRQMCCLSNIFDIPADEGQCCFDQAYRFGDPDNMCIGSCGDNDNFNSETQLCCDGVTHRLTSRYDVCCGRRMISTRTHVCCGEGTVLARRGRYGCCRDFMPYVRRYMRCRRGRIDGGRQLLRRRTSVPFRSSFLCRALPVWGQNWPLPQMQNTGEMLQIKGRVDFVSRGQGDNLRLTLSPFRIIQLASTDGISTCMDGDAVNIATNLGPSANERRCRRRQLRRYLNDNDLTVFFPLSSLLCRNGTSPVIKVPETSAEHLLLLTSSED